MRRFREEAQAHGELDPLARAWLARSGATGLWRDYPWLAARELWARWTPDLLSIPVFIKQHLPWDAFDAVPDSPEEAERHWRMARAVIDLVAPPAGALRADLLDQLEEVSDIDLRGWLRHLPFSLARLGMVDEALEIGTRMAPVTEAETFRGDRAVILAAAGRREEALEQVEANLARFPEDVWVRIKAGDAYRELGDPARAEGMYRGAVAMTEGAEDASDRNGAVRRLADLLDDLGRSGEADALFDAEAVRRAEADEPFDGEIDREPRAGARDGDLPTSLAETDQMVKNVQPAGADGGADGAQPSPPPPEPLIVRRAGPKVGRNQSCPCGSGKKFKRCCGR
jgi:tetratricopeptide (TPR) repeat protein